MKGSKCIAVVVAIVMAVIGNVPAGAYTFSQTRKESPQDFNEFPSASKSCRHFRIFHQTITPQRLIP